MKSKAKPLVYSAIIAAMYTVLTLVSFSFGLSGGVVQVRISEALTVLPFFTPYAISGLFVGCIISNILTGCAIWDIIFGSIATLLGAMLTYRAGKSKHCKASYLAPAGPILSNTLIIPLILTYVYGAKEAYWFICLTVGIGEVISAGIFGMILIFAVRKHKDRLF